MDQNSRFYYGHLNLRKKTQSDGALCVSFRDHEEYVTKHPFMPVPTDMVFQSKPMIIWSIKHMMSSSLWSGCRKCGNWSVWHTRLEASWGWILLSHPFVGILSIILKGRKIWFDLIRKSQLVRPVMDFVVLFFDRN